MYTLSRSTMSQSNKGVANLQKSPQTHGSCSRITEIKPLPSLSHALLKVEELNLATSLV